MENPSAGVLAFGLLLLGVLLLLSAAGIGGYFSVLIHNKTIRVFVGIIGVALFGIGLVGVVRNIFPTSPNNSTASVNPIETNVPDIILTVTAIGLQNSQTQQAYFHQLKLTEQAVLATVTAISGQRPLPASSQTPHLVKAVAKEDTSLHLYADDNSKAVGFVRAGTEVYIEIAAVDIQNQPWFLIRVYLTDSSSLYGWVHSSSIER